MKQPFLAAILGLGPPYYSKILQVLSGPETLGTPAEKEMLIFKQFLEQGWDGRLTHFAHRSISRSINLISISRAKKDLSLSNGKGAAN